MLPRKMNGDDGLPRVVGLLLAAGAGSRFGGPKVLVRAADGTPWVRQRVQALQEGGCARTVVVLGAQAQHARPMVPCGVESVVAEQWDRGLSESLKAGLGAAAAGGGSSAVVVALVDTPGLNATVVRRFVELASHGDAVLARAVYLGVPGHPVLLGRAHWQPVAAHVSGDAGAGAYLRRNGVEDVECSDVADGDDVDVPPDSRRGV